MFSLSGKMAVVTGASGGIGAAIAQALHQQGATVMLTGRREDALQQLAATLRERAHILPADIASAEDVEKLITGAERTLGRIDILVNNAGVTRDTLILRMSDEDWGMVLNTNLTSAFRLCKAAVRGMMKNRAGRIINISSVVGVTGNAGQVNYAASKAGLIGFTKSLAQEVASRGITVNAIAPGFIKTDMTDKLNDEQKAKLTERIPLGRMGTPEDIAAATAFLASDAAAYITGHTLNVNGGMAMI